MTDSADLSSAGPNNGAYRCGMPQVKVSGIPAATQLSAVGLTISDLK